MEDEIDYEALYNERDKLKEEMEELTNNFSCGCGAQDKINDFVIKFIESQSQFHGPDRPKPSPGGMLPDPDAHRVWYKNLRAEQAKLISDNIEIVNEFILKVLDVDNFLEHGSMIWNAWLSDKGKRLLEIDKRLKEIEKL